LFSIFPGQIKSNTVSSVPTPLTEAPASEQVVMTCCCQPKETLQPSKGTPKGLPLTQMDDPAATQRHVILASFILESEQLFGFVSADEDEIEDHKNDSFLASNKHMFISVHVRPQPISTYGQCMAYSAGTVEHPVPVGTFVKFPSATRYLVAKSELVELMRDAIGPDVRLLLSDAIPAKRMCVRLPDTGGEQAEDVEGKTKGT
jgi:hypothetical protein